MLCDVALAKSGDDLDKAKDHSGAAPWPCSGGHTLGGLEIQDEIILPHMCCAPQKAPGWWGSASCKESRSPRNGSPTYTVPFSPELGFEQCLHHQLNVETSRRFLNHPPWVFWEVAGMSSKGTPQTSHEKAEHGVRGIAAGWQNALVLGFALGTCGVCAGSGVGHGAPCTPTQPTDLGSPWGTLGLPLQGP